MLTNVLGLEWILFAVLAAWAITWLFLVFARRHRLLDAPNERSSHSVPTPRGGGLSIVVTSSAALLALAAWGIVELDLAIALGIGGGAVAVVGFIDDRWGVRPRLRLFIHLASAAWAVAWLGGLHALHFGTVIVQLGWVGNVLAVVAIAFALNLFNFMDGIDGIAASEAAFICFAGAFLGFRSGVSPGACVQAIIIGAASLGFLAWNWPPARIFLGDVGSGYLGYVIAVLATAFAQDNAVALLVWLILAGVFLIDSTLTLFRRFARGERVYAAHRTHAYQRLARLWGSHRNVTLAVIAINLAWLFPIAFLATLYPHLAGWLVLVALAPIVIAVALAGAGRVEGT